MKIKVWGAKWYYGNCGVTFDILRSVFQPNALTSKNGPRNPRRQSHVKLFTISFPQAHLSCVIINRLQIYFYLFSKKKRSNLAKSLLEIIFFIFAR